MSIHFNGGTFFTCEKFPQRLSDAPPSKTRLEHERARPRGVAHFPTNF